MRLSSPPFSGGETKGESLDGGDLLPIEKDSQLVTGGTG
jgi:hypothetical protein